MSLGLEILSKEAWSDYSADAHMICFQEIRPPEMDRYDFVMLSTWKGAPCTYITCREIDNETIYWQYGGAFPNVKGGVVSFAAYQQCINWTKEQYKRITTLISNENTTMLKFAAKVGYKIIGIRNFKGEVLLEHLLEFKE